ncbi:MAG TPA: hypothetical protein VGN12_17175 [Pirellulales bacterium]|jgi:hypothetical protein
MPKTGIAIIRAGSTEHHLKLSLRDVHLLDGAYFFRDGWMYRQLLGLDFIAGLRGPPKDTVLVTHKRKALLVHLGNLLTALESQRELISYDYAYGFADEKFRRHSGGMTGFRVQGGFGHISVRPSGYCDLTIADEDTSGHGRIFAIVDMRVRHECETEDRGILRVYRKQASVGWFDELAKLIAFLKKRTVDTVEVLHSAGG